MRCLLALLSIAVAACSSSALGGDGGAVDQAHSGGPDQSAGYDLALAIDLAIGDGPLASRPYTMNLHVPAGYDATKPTPLVMMLHGYSASGAVEEVYFNFTAVSDAHTFLYVYPDGDREASPSMYRFWNATDACCNFYGSTVDDSSYLDAVLADIRGKFNVDAKRVYVVGHSNGGFMTHRMACDHASEIAAVMALAGDTFKDQGKCAAGSPVAVLQVQGDADAVVNYAGGMLLPGGALFPGSRETIGDWATKNGCTGTLAATGQMLDLDTVLPGAETTVEAFVGCPTGSAAELWTIKGGSHVPAFQTNPANMPTWGELVWGWLSMHVKP
jgi:polyhydroxybutyrate depolymerase